MQHKDNPRYIPVDAIDQDGSSQSRATIRQGTIDEYSNALRDNVNYPFPSIDVFEDPKDLGKFYIGDGWHRVLAAKQSETPNVLAFIHSGTRRDACLFSVGANTDHGIRRSYDDKRRAVAMLLADPEWSKKTIAWIADTAKVSKSFVVDCKGPEGKEQLERLKAEISTNPAISGVASESANGGDSVYEEEYDASEEAETAPLFSNEEEDDEHSEDKENLRGEPVTDQEELPTKKGTTQRVAASVGRDRVAMLLKRYANEIQNTKNGITSLASLEPEGRHVRRGLQRLQEQCKSIIGTLESYAPAGACPKCNGNGCEKCLMTGHVTKIQAASSASAPVPF